MKKTVLIIEDNISQAEMLKKLVEEVNPNADVYIRHALEPAYALLLERTIDVFMVDIMLDTTKSGDTSGIYLVEKLRKIRKYMFTPVVFITALEDEGNYAYKDLHCRGYIEKPFDKEHVKKVIEDALCFTTDRGENATLHFKRDGILYPIKVREITYMEIVNHKVCIHFATEPVFEVNYKSCKVLLAEADADCLLQCSRSTIINKDYVRNVDPVSRYITMKPNDEKVEIGFTYKKRILREFGDDN